MEHKKLQKLPIGISDFRELITGDHLYVDKTKYIYNLIEEGKAYFLARPRRFGKSLLISTLKEVFSGNRTFFEGLWIAGSDYDWQSYPVIHLDFSDLRQKDPAQLEEALIRRLVSLANAADINIKYAGDIMAAAETLIVGLQEKTKKNVVIFVDEYDYPIINNLADPLVAQTMRERLGDFFSTLKRLSASIRFMFLTGVTKFAKTSIFSGFNNLIDLTMDDSGELLLGYTEEEIKQHFTPHLDVISSKQGVSNQAILDELRVWYDGYNFVGDGGATKLYTPFSILNYFRNGKIANYWFASGTPTFLVEQFKLQYHDQLPPNLEHVFASPRMLDAFEIEAKIPLVTLLFQTGYLTIKNYDKDNRSYTLGIPNQEVRESLYAYLLSVTTHSDISASDELVNGMKIAINQADLRSFFTHLQSLFATIPYTLYVDKEAYFHSIILIISSMLGLDIQAEVAVSTGRIDLVIMTRKNIFVIELKFNKTGSEALEQVKSRRYHEKYQGQAKPITLVGASFNYDDKRLTIDWLMEAA